MTKRVVDILESVEVDEQDPDALMAAPRLRDRLREPLLQQHAVGKPGQRVARGQVLEPLFGLDARGHILDERQDRHDPPLLVEQA